MYIKILISFFLGYLHIEIEGFFIERLINTCIAKRILLWNIKRTKSTIAYCNIGIRDFKKLKNIIRKNKCKVKIISKNGLPFIINRYKKRKIFLIIILFFSLCIGILSNFVWNVEIIGNEQIEKEELMIQLNENGINIGTLKNKINTKEVINKLRLIRNDLAWMGIEIKGTNVIVKVVEAAKKPDIIDENEYCNIIATKPRNYSKSKCRKWYAPSRRR